MTQQIPPAPWIATVLVGSRHPQFQHPKISRSLDTKFIIRRILESTSGDGIIVFPAGWHLYAGPLRKAHYQRIEARITRLLEAETAGRNVVVVVGIDGELRGDIPVDQCAAAICRDGILAIARKVFGTKDEVPIIRAAPDHLVGEHGYPRTFQLGGRSFYIATCYDIFGIRHCALPNPGVDAILSLVHGFTPRGLSGSGDVYFARLGFAGASRAWECPVYGAAVFFQRPIPPRWPSGVLWGRGGRRGRYWRYADNGMRPEKVLRVELMDGRSEVRVFGAMSAVAGDHQQVPQIGEVGADFKASTGHAVCPFSNEPNCWIPMDHSIEMTTFRFFLWSSTSRSTPGASCWSARPIT